MKSIPIYQVDAFTSQVFHGNPAAVCPLNEWLPEITMLQIARENNLAETAFFTGSHDQFLLRWFTPDREIDLCGHATLATAYVIFNEFDIGKDHIVFDSQSGELYVRNKGDNLMELDFPLHPPEAVDVDDRLREAFNFEPQETAGARDLIVRFESEDQIRNLSFNPEPVKDLSYLCIVPTAKGVEHDFVSRCFDPNATLMEDPVTGSTHCSLAPFWSERLDKDSFSCAQLSERGGELHCTIRDDRVLISGHSVLYLKGEIFL